MKIGEIVYKASAEPPKEDGPIDVEATPADWYQ
jgi:hypothetical protein